MGFLEEEKNISLLKTKLMLVILNSGIFLEKTPHNNWIIFPQWLDHPTTIESLLHNDWIPPQTLDKFPAMIRSATLPWSKGGGRGTRRLVVRPLKKIFFKVVLPY